MSDLSNTGIIFQLKQYQFAVKYGEKCSREFKKTYEIVFRKMNCLINYESNCLSKFNVKFKIQISQHSRNLVFLIRIKFIFYIFVEKENNHASEKYYQIRIVLKGVVNAVSDFYSSVTCLVI